LVLFEIKEEDKFSTVSQKCSANSSKHCQITVSSSKPSEKQSFNQQSCNIFFYSSMSLSSSFASPVLSR